MIGHGSNPSRRAIALGAALTIAGLAVGPVGVAGAARKASVSIITVDALKASIKKRHGRPVLLHFWASWCLPCMEELPVVDEFARQMRPRGLDVLSLSLDDPGRGPEVIRVLRQKAPNLTPNILRVEDINALLATVDPDWQGAIPAVFALDQRGDLRGRFIGGASRQQLDSLVGYMLKPAKKR